MSPTRLTPKESVNFRLVNLPVDRIPNLCILMTFAARRIGCTYDQYVQDYRLLVEGNLRCCDEFQIDMLSVISDPVRETNDLGSRIVLPNEQRIIRTIHALGAKARLHICGNITSLLEIVPETGADIIDIDYPVEFSAAVAALSPSIAANGKFEPSRILLQGTEEDVKQAVRQCALVSNISFHRKKSRRGY